MWDLSQNHLQSREHTAFRLELPTYHEMFCHFTEQLTSQGLQQWPWSKVAARWQTHFPSYKAGKLVELLLPEICSELFITRRPHLKHPEPTKSLAHSIHITYTPHTDSFWFIPTAPYPLPVFFILSIKASIIFSLNFWTKCGIWWEL